MRQDRPHRGSAAGSRQPPNDSQADHDEQASGDDTKTTYVEPDGADRAARVHVGRAPLQQRALPEHNRANNELVPPLRLLQRTNNVTVRQRTLCPKYNIQHLQGIKPLVWVFSAGPTGHEAPSFTGPRAHTQWHCPGNA